jgi:hypothetical protein
MNNINTRTWLLAAACAIALCPALHSQTVDAPSGAKQAGNSAKTKKRTVKQLDGKKLFGFVEVTDDYTIRVSNDWGIRLPIAELGDADFRKSGLRKIGPRTDVFGTSVKRRSKSSKKIRNLRTKQDPVKSPLWKSSWPKSQHFNL